MEHSKLPWTVDESCPYLINSPNNDCVAGCAIVVPVGENAEANAAFIVRACNAHDDLSRELKALVEVLESHANPKTGDVFIPGGALSLVLSHAALLKAGQGLGGSIR